MKWYWWLAIAAVVVISVLYYQYKTRQQQALTMVQERINAATQSDAMAKTRLFTEQDALQALSRVKNLYGVDMARSIEKVARLETNHFKSLQYKTTGTGGMEAHGAAPYYGWYSPFFIKNPEYTPIGTTDMLENEGASKIGGNAQSNKPKAFVIMPSVEAWMMFLADYAIRYKNNGGILRWYSTNKDSQNLYASTLAKINTPLINSIS